MNAPTISPNTPRIGWRWPVRTIMTVTLVLALIVAWVVNATAHHSPGRHGIISFPGQESGKTGDELWVNQVAIQLNQAVAHPKPPEELSAEDMSYNQQMDILASAMCELPPVDVTAATSMDQLPKRQFFVEWWVNSLGAANYDYHGVYVDFTQRVWDKCLVLPNGAHFAAATG